MKSKGHTMQIEAGKNGHATGAQLHKKLKRKDYEKELARLHAELVKLQHWVVEKRLRVCVVALPAPTDREKSQMYLQRYIRYFPAAGEVVIFDRSWYNRAGVERVMGFCTEDQAQRFLQATPLVEKTMTDSGIILLKYWLEVSPEEQTRRLESRIEDGRKLWKLSPMDLKSYSRWYDYSKARDEMFAATDTRFAPWYVANADDKKRVRLNIITHLLSQIPYEELPHEKIKLPKRQKANGYKNPDYPHNYVPEKF
jgi:polyphosphate kinase 2